MMWILLAGLIVSVCINIFGFLAFKNVIVPYLLARKRKMPIFILQTPSSAVIKVPIKQVHNWFHLSDTEVAIATPHSIKGSPIGQIAVGDYYCSLTAPPDVLIAFEKQMSEDKTIEDFQKWIYDIADDKIKRKGEFVINPDTNKKIKEKTKGLVEFKFYKLIDYATIKDFVNIGLNPTLLNLQRKSGELTERLKAMEGRNWMNIVMPIVILLIVAAVIYMLISGHGGQQVAQVVASATGGGKPPVIKP